MTCRECRFVVPIYYADRPKDGSDASLYECHRTHPVAYLEASFASWPGVWPRVQATDWCGEFRAVQP